MNQYTGLNRGLHKAGPYTIANLAIRRERVGKDMIVVIIGDRGSGKSTLGIRIIDAYLNIKKDLGEIDSICWKGYFKSNFAINTVDAINKYQKLEYGTFLNMDEGGDIAYSGDAMTKVQKALIKFVAKIREKRIFTVICLPYMEMLSKKMLKMTHNLIVVPYRYENLWAYAFVYTKSGNVLIGGDGYGIDKVKKVLESGLKYDYVMAKRNVTYKGEYVTEMYPKYVFRKLMKIPSYNIMFRFKDLDPQLKAMYHKYVKSRLIEGKVDIGLVPQVKYNSLDWRYRTLLYNLYTKNGLNKKQLERAHIDKFGNPLMSSHRIGKILDSVCAREARPNIEDEDDE